MLVGDRVVKSFVLRVREKLLDFDFDREFDGVEAAHALPEGDGVDVGRDEDAIVQGLETDIQVDDRAVLHADDSIAEALAENSVKLAFAHLTGTVHEVEHRDGERGGSEIRHEGRFYALSVLRAPPRPGPRVSRHARSAWGRILPTSTA